jgi:hypothetical protein
MHPGTEAHIDRRRLFPSLAATAALPSDLFASFDEADTFIANKWVTDDD